MLEAWESEFGYGYDPSKLGVERNILRYVPTQVLVRADESASVADAVRVVLAGLAAGAPMALSVGKDLPVAVRGILENKGIKYLVESDEAWRTYLASNAKTPVRALAGTPLEGTRIRYIGDDVKSVYTALGGRPDVAVYFHPVTEAGRIEMLPFLREQAVSITAHRFGNPNPFSESVISSR